MPRDRLVGKRRSDGCRAHRCLPRDPERFWAFYGERFATLDSKEPNDAHRVLVTLEEHGLLDAVITQNIDMLHRKAGTRELVEVHGSIERCLCPACGVGRGLEDACEPWRAHPTVFPAARTAERR